MVLWQLQLTIVNSFTEVAVRIVTNGHTRKLRVTLLELVVIIINLSSGNFQGLKLIHLCKIYSLKVVVRNLQAQVLQVYELTEEESLINETSWPLEV